MLALSTLFAVQLCAGLPAALPAPAGVFQDARKQRAILKREIDDLIRRLDGREFPSPLEAAKWIVALVRCPRHYGLEDGPILRRPLRKILNSRRADGLFGPGDTSDRKRLLETSRWVVQALADLDAYPELLEAAREAVAKAAPEGRFVSPWRPVDLAKGAAAGGPPNVDLLVAKVAAYEILGAGAPAARPSARWEPFQQKALNWLLDQARDGVWYVPGPKGEARPEPGVTALALAALAAKPAAKRTEREREVLDQGRRFLLAHQLPDGSFSTELPNYVTCAAIMALAGSGLEGAPRAIAKAREFLLSIQNVEARGYRPGDRDYGSIGYGGDRRGDLSNTQMALDALRTAGLPKDHDAIQKALIFLRRCQNLPGKGSWTGIRRTADGRRVQVRAGSDGGAAYYPGNSPAGYDPTSDGAEIPRSYGSMTYALLKCYVLAGLPKNDPRLQAALAWAAKHWTLDENPGAAPKLGEKARYQGLFYYYLTLARALALAGLDQLAGHDWRAELRAKLKELQKPEGFWVNERNGRWWEASPVLCTAYALLALAQ